MAEVVLTAQIDDEDVLVRIPFGKNMFKRGRDYGEIRPGTRDRTLPGRHRQPLVVVRRGGTHGQPKVRGKERRIAVLAAQIGVM